MQPQTTHQVVPTKTMFTLLCKECQRPFGADTQFQHRDVDDQPKLCSACFKAKSAQYPRKAGDDLILLCVDCHEEFIFPRSAQEYFQERGYKENPRRCKHCFLTKEKDGTKKSR